MNKEPTRQKRKLDDPTNGGPAQSHKQSKIAFPTVQRPSGKQKNFEQDLANYVVYAIKPFSTPDDEYFKKMIQGLDPKINVISRSTLMKRIDDSKKVSKEEVKDSVSKAKYVCTAADIWSGNHHAYMGCSAHWINENFERQSRVLACRHFESPHTAERIGEILCGVHAEYGLEAPRIVASVTDNARNMIKAFEVFGIEFEHDDEFDEAVDLEFPEYILPKHLRYVFVSSKAVQL